MVESYSINRVKKRDGQIALFDESKIVEAIYKAAQAEIIST